MYRRAGAAIVLADPVSLEEENVTRTFDLRRFRPVGWLLLLVALLIPLGCSISASSKSSSDSSASSSGSSSPGDTAYFDDVRSATEAYAKSGGPFDAYQKQLGDLAKQHGVTNWEENLGTYAAIGEGLGQAKASQGLVDTFKERLAPAGSPNNADKQSAIQKGYDSKK
jgi:hypothetical protein